MHAVDVEALAHAKVTRLATGRPAAALALEIEQAREGGELAAGPGRTVAKRGARIGNQQPQRKRVGARLALFQQQQSLGTGNLVAIPKQKQILQRKPEGQEGCWFLFLFTSSVKSPIARASFSKIRAFDRVSMSLQKTKAEHNNGKGTNLPVVDVRLADAGHMLLVHTKAEEHLVVIDQMQHLWKKP